MSLARSTKAATPTPSLWRGAWIAVGGLLLLAAALGSGSTWFLTYVHVFTALLWTGTDIFLGFVLGPVLRRLDLPVRQAVILQLVPRTLFYMPTLSAVTITAGFGLAGRIGWFLLPAPQIYWVWAAIAIVAILTAQGLGYLLPTNLRIYFELRKDRPDGERVRRWMRGYLAVVASQGLMQLAIIAVMTRLGGPA